MTPPTSPAVTFKQAEDNHRRRHAKMTPEQRVALACGLSDVARTLGRRLKEAPGGRTEPGASARNLPKATEKR
jgi:hypothetical protein